uniref:Mediator of RNA polymerase II transcription subunit 28 n=1 Tax=Cebus imitator TaxID=2715852 RepID=A0A2K5PGQ0_CEBIM
MVAPLGGMFSGQPPPGHPGQASLLQAAPGTPRPSNSTLVDELESSFEACFACLVSQDYVNGTDQEEIQTGVDQCIQMFLDIARQTECFSPKKDCSYQSRSQNTLVQKHLTKVRHWQQVLEDINEQHKMPADIPQGSLTYLEQASANIPAPLKPT